MSDYTSSENRERTNTSLPTVAVRNSSELAIHGLPQHLVLDHLFLADTELACVFGDLLVDERSTHEAGADDVGADPVFPAFLGGRLAQADEAVLGGHSLATRSAGGFPAMIAELIGPMEIPATQ